MKATSILLTVLALTIAGCGNDGTLRGSAGTTADEPGATGTTGGDDGDGNTNGGDGETPGSTEEEPGASACAVTHFTSGDESRFRVAGDGDCIKCPGPADVIKLTYTGTGFVQELVFDGSRTNGANAAADELILEQSGNVCWSEAYDAGGDLPSASAFTVDGHASTIEFDKGPDVAGSSGTLSYYKNGVLQFAIPVVEGGELAPYPDDGVQLK